MVEIDAALPLDEDELALLESGFGWSLGFEGRHPTAFDRHLLYGCPIIKPSVVARLVAEVRRTRAGGS